MYNSFGSYNPYSFNSYPMSSGNQTLPQRMEIIKVSGKNGAEAFNLAPNSSVLLLDETEPIIWLKTTDGAGYPTVIPYSITPYQPEPIIDTKSLEERITRLEEIINESYSYADNDAPTKADETNSKPSKRLKQPTGNA